MKRTTCSACGDSGLELFLDLGRSPLADAYQDSPDATPPTYPLQLAVCTGCWLVQLLEVVPGDLLFESGYSFYSSASPPLSAYHERYAHDLLARHGELAKRLVVEIGCNDGDFLRHFAGTDYRVVGVDPAVGPGREALRRGLEVWCQPFNQKVADDLLYEHGPAGVVVANHVLAHVESVSDVLEGVSRLLAPDGVAYVEVQYLPDLLVNNAFDLVYHEHRNFFSLSSLKLACERWGLRVVDVELTDRQGGSLRAQLVHAGTGAVPRTSVDTLTHREHWLRSPCAYDGFQGRVDRIVDRLRDLVLARHDQVIVGYGAPAKATTLLNYAGFDSSVIPVVTDTTTAKHRKYVPGVGALIVPPDEVDFGLVDLVLVNAWNYAPRILRQHPEFRGQWLLPIPAPVVL